MKLDKNKVALYFEAYPKASVLYFTADGYCFLEEHKAASHASSKGIEYVSSGRDSFRDEQDEDLREDESASEAEAKAQLLEMELTEDCEFSTLQALGKALGVKARSKADYLSGLIETKAKLSVMESEEGETLPSETELNENEITAEQAEKKEED